MVNVGIIEDHKAYRKALAELLSISGNFKTVTQYDSAEAALDNMSGQEKIILLDINLSKMSGIEAITHLKKINSEVKIIMLTMLDDDNTVLQAILNGADGYLLKKSPPQEILNAIDICMQGGSPMTPGIATKVLQLFKKFVPQKNESYRLTKREIEILDLLVNGLSNHQIADRLFISIETVRNHIRHIYEKLQVHSKSQAVVKALKEGLV